MADTHESPVRATAEALRAEGLGKRVPLPSGELTILDGVGFTIAKGEAVAIVGASGSGKSTLLSLLAGLDVPSDGQVKLDGETWEARGPAGTLPGEKVVVIAVDGLVLDVEPAE